MHLFFVPHSRLDVNVPHTQTRKSRPAVRELSNLRSWTLDLFVCHQMTTYPRLVGDASCQKYRSDKALPTHCFLIIGDVTGGEAFRAVFTSLSLGVFDQRRSALARW